MEENIMSLIGVQDGNGSADMRNVLGWFLTQPADHQLWDKRLQNKMMILEEEAEHG